MSSVLPLAAGPIPMPLRMLHHAPGADDAAVSYPDIEAGSNSFRRTAKAGAAAAPGVVNPSPGPCCHCCAGPTRPKCMQVAADDVPSLYPQVP